MWLRLLQAVCTIPTRDRHVLNAVIHQLRVVVARANKYGSQGEVCSGHGDKSYRMGCSHHACLAHGSGSSLLAAALSAGRRHACPDACLRVCKAMSMLQGESKHESKHVTNHVAKHVTKRVTKPGWRGRYILLTREAERVRSLLRCFCIAFFSTCLALRASAATSAAAASSAAAAAAASSFCFFSSSAFLLRAAALSCLRFSLRCRNVASSLHCLMLRDLTTFWALDTSCALYPCR